MATNRRRARMAKDEAREDMPEGFTLTMALVDAVPVVLFCLSCIALGRRIGSALPKRSGSK
jgi:hypothetical protein